MSHRPVLARVELLPGTLCAVPDHREPGIRPHQNRPDPGHESDEREARTCAVKYVPGAVTVCRTLLQRITAVRTS
ncbi:MAG: hypothetical protein JWM87_2855 [Candidatus Eremiobacteraeota bacterium]|nr:hypothetical protein [Candidatus Eremiobacteraeota bacterium]